MLALRGWGVEEFRLVTPEFRSVVHYALLAERLGPALVRNEAEAAESIPKGMAPTDLAAAMRERLAAKDAATQLREFLYPED